MSHLKNAFVGGMSDRSSAVKTLHQCETAVKLVINADFPMLLRAALAEVPPITSAIRSAHHLRRGRDEHTTLLTVVVWIAQ